MKRLIYWLLIIALSMANHIKKDEVQLKDLRESYERYKTATTYDEIIKSAEDYNYYYDKYFMPFGDNIISQKSVENRLKRYRLKTKKISPEIYNLKAHFSNVENPEDYYEFWFYFKEDESEAYIILTDIDENYVINSLSVLKPTGDIVNLNLDDIYTKEITKYVKPYGMTDNYLFVMTIANAEYFYWKFDITKNNSTAEPMEFLVGDYSERCFYNLEDFNMEEPWF